MKRAVRAPLIPNVCHPTPPDLPERPTADTPLPAGDPCRAPLPMVFKVAITPGPCQVITLQDTQIRLGSYRPEIPNSPEVSFAVIMMRLSNQP